MKSTLTITALTFMLASCAEETKCTNRQTGVKGTAMFGICVGGGCSPNPSPVSVKYIGDDGYDTEATYDPTKWKCGEHLKDTNQ